MTDHTYVENVWSTPNNNVEEDEGAGSEEVDEPDAVGEGNNDSYHIFTTFHMRYLNLDVKQIDLWHKIFCTPFIFLLTSNFD